MTPEEIAAIADFLGRPVEEVRAMHSRKALGRVTLKAPTVVRLDGTNAEEGRQILADAGIPDDVLTSRPTMLEAARTAVAIANGERSN